MVTCTFLPEYFMPQDAARRERVDLDLLRRHHATHDPRAQDELVRRYRPFVRALVRQYKDRGEPVDDLMQVAYLGLIKAIDRFDVDSGHRFVTYAAPTILGELKRHFRDHTWAIRVPRSLQELTARITTHQRISQETRGREATVAGLAAALNETPDRIRDAVGAGNSYRPMSLDHSVAGGLDLRDVYGELDPGYEAIEHRSVVEDAVAALDERRRSVVRQSFYDERIQREIARDVGVSQMQVSRLLGQSMDLMRQHIEGRASSTDALSRPPCTDSQGG